MSKIKKYLSPRFLIYFISILLIIFNYPVFNKPSQSMTEGIVTAVAIDLSGEDMEVACSILTPTGDKSGKTNLYVEKAPTIAKAINKISVLIGKDLGFAQCDVVAVGSKILNEGVFRAVDYFSRTKKVDRNVMLIAFEGKPSELIESMIFLRENLSLTIPDILTYNKENLLGTESNVEAFYNGYYGDSGLNIIPKLTINEDESDGGIEVEVQTSSNGGGGGSSSDSSSSSSSGGSGSGKKKYLLNDGTASVVKDGRYLKDLKPDDIKRINLIVNDSKYGTFKVSGVADDVYKNATVVCAMENKNLKSWFSFKDGKPKVTYNLQLFLIVEEVIEEKNDKTEIRETELLTDKVVEKIIEKTKLELNALIQDIKKDNTDYLGLYDFFNKFYYKQWEKYLNTLENKEEYLKDIEFEFNVKVSEFL